jgi:hypothetical protein
MDMEQQETGKQDPSYSVDIHFHHPLLARPSNNLFGLTFAQYFVSQASRKGYGRGMRLTHLKHAKSEGKKSGCWRTAKSAARVQMKEFTSEDEGFVFRLS